MVLRLKMDTRDIENSRDTLPGEKHMTGIQGTEEVNHTGWEGGVQKQNA